MPLIDPHLTLGALVTEHPALAREMERLRLDYCCRGQRSLQDACRDRGLDPAAVATALAASAANDAGPDSWATMGPAELVDHLEATHHAYLWRELPRIVALADKVTIAHGDRRSGGVGEHLVHVGQLQEVEPGASVLGGQVGAHRS